MRTRRVIPASVALFVSLLAATALPPMPVRAQRAPGGAPGSDLQVLARKSLATIDGTLPVAGLRERVEVIRDRWGVPHIYAQNTEDLFFAQGYVIAQDRLWQMEMWRRQYEGRLAEILGPAAFARDRQTRLLKYRGPFDDREWTSYHPEAKRIVTAFVQGVNAFIATHADRLPVEFVLTGITPEPWTPETALLRAGGFGDATNEITLARMVAEVGAHEANLRRQPDPWDVLTVPDGLDVSVIGADVLAAMRGAGGRLPAPEVSAPYRPLITNQSARLLPDGSVAEPGSNNWVIGSAHSATGRPIVANDPHRDVTNPSLRYIVHLNAPGWNAIGAQEPPFVGIALGHNERVGWGFTITGTDQHDVFVEEVNPANANEVRYNGAWEPLRIVREEISVKGEAPRAIELKFSRHGPIFFEDAKNHRAYALRSALNEPGTAPYLAGLRLAQARNCAELLDAALYWKAPSENIICGDVEGNIGFQGSALTPQRKGWSGRLPVPGTGRYEWQGFRTDLPRIVNPNEGFIATANNNVNVPGTAPVMFKTLTAIPFERVARVRQVLTSLVGSRKLTLEDSTRLQHDIHSLRGAFEQELFRGWTSSDAAIERARQLVAGWDANLHKDSPAAALYIAWREAVDDRALEMTRPRAERLPHVEPGLRDAVAELTKTQGADPAAWRYGRLHGRDFPHPFVSAFDLPRVERSGGNGAVAADGASYREVLDVADWDRSLVTNVPGQSGQPGSPFYGNLLPLWDRGEYFPLVYSRARVDEAKAHTLVLQPGPATRSSR